MRVVVDQWPHPYAKSSLSKQTRLWIEQLTFETGSLELSVNQFFQKIPRAIQNDKQKPRVAVREDLFTNELEWALGRFTHSRARVRARKINFPGGIPQGPNFQVILFF